MDAKIARILALCREHPEWECVPTLIGPPRWGKTYMIRTLAKEWDVPLVIINPQVESPEEVAGFAYRRALKSGASVAEYTLPPVLPRELMEQGGVLFVDEMDKAKERMLSSLLTLFGERRLRWTKIPDNVFLVCAMNEPRTTLPDAMVGRMMFLPIPRGVTEAHKRDYGVLSSLAPRIYEAPPTVSFPVRPHAPDALHKLARWAALREFWDDSELKELVVRGLYNEHQAVSVLNMLSELPPVLDPVKWSKGVRLQDIRTLLPQVCANATPQEFAKMVETFNSRAQKDKSGETLKVLKEIFEDVPFVAQLKVRT